MTKYLAGVLSVIAVGVLLIAYGLQGSNWVVSLWTGFAWPNISELEAW